MHRHRIRPVDGTSPDTLADRASAARESLERLIRAVADAEHADPAVSAAAWRQARAMAGRVQRDALALADAFERVSRT